MISCIATTPLETCSDTCFRKERNSYVQARHFLEMNEIRMYRPTDIDGGPKHQGRGPAVYQLHRHHPACQAETTEAVPGLRLQVHLLTMSRRSLKFCGAVDLS